MDCAQEQWRKDRASGRVAEALKPQQNDRPEFAAKGQESLLYF
jgi:glyoxylase I family protein